MLLLNEFVYFVYHNKSFTKIVYHRSFATTDRLPKPINVADRLPQVIYSKIVYQTSQLNDGDDLNINYKVDCCVVLCDFYLAKS